MTRAAPGADEVRPSHDRPDTSAPPDTSLETLAIAVGAGVLAAVNAPAPTGQPVVDAILVGAAVAGVVWFGSVVSVSFAGGVALAAGVLSFNWIGLVLGAIAFIASRSLVGDIRWSHRASPILLGLALNIVARGRLGEVEGLFAASAAAGCGLAAVIIIRAFPLQRRRRRGIVLAAGAGALVLTVGAGIALATSASRSADDLRAGEEIVLDALDLLAEGEIPEAQASLERAAAAFERAHDRLASPLNHAAVVVPVAAQHRRAGVDLSAEAARSSATMAEQLATIDLDQLTLRNGRIDVEAIAALTEPLLVIQEDLARLRDTVIDVDSPWLVDAVGLRLDDLRVDLDTQLERSDDLVRVVEQIPSMLGAEGRRVYFVGFTTPAEARGLGGFLGNYAEISVENGDIELTRFGRADDLDEAAAPGERFLEEPTGWLDRYGRFGFDNGPAEGVGAQPFKNVTLSPDMAATGQVIAELYAQSGGRHVDGVIVLDVFAVSALLEFTGPIDVPGFADAITAESAPRFLLNDQYEETDTSQRIDLLEIVSNRVFDTLLNSDLPPPQRVLEILGPQVEEGRLMAFAQAPREQEMLEEIGLAGTLVNPAGGDGLAITLNNAIGNKIDFFLRSAASYTVVADATTGTATAELELVLENQAPRFGEPNYVIGNAIALPDGSNRTWVSVYSRLRVESATVDGTPVDTEQTTEAGYFVTGVFIDLASRETSTLRLTMAGPLDLGDGYDLVLRAPPTARPMTIELDTTLRDGDTEATDTGTIRKAGRYDVSLPT